MGSSNSNDIEHEPHCKHYNPDSKPNDELVSKTNKDDDDEGKPDRPLTAAPNLRNRGTTKSKEGSPAFNEDDDKDKVDLHEFTTTEPSFVGLMPFFLSGLLASNLVIDSMMPLEDRVVYHRHFIQDFANSIVQKFIISSYTFLVVQLLFGTIRDMKLSDTVPLILSLGSLRFYFWARTAAIKMVSLYEANDTEAAMDQSISCVNYEYVVFLGFLMVGIIKVKLQPTALHSLAYIYGLVLMQYYFANIRATPDVYIIFIKAELLAITSWPSLLKWAPAVAGVTTAIALIPSYGFNKGRVALVGTWFWMIYRFATDAFPNMNSLASQPTNMVTAAFRESREALRRDYYLFLVLLLLALASYYLDEGQRVLASNEVIQWRYEQLNEKQKKQVSKFFSRIGKKQHFSQFSWWA